MNNNIRHPCFSNVLNCTTVIYNHVFHIRHKHAICTNIIHNSIPWRRSNNTQRMWEMCLEASDMMRQTKMKQFQVLFFLFFSLKCFDAASIFAKGFFFLSSFFFFLLLLFLLFFPSADAFLTAFILFFISFVTKLKTDV